MNNQMTAPTTNDLSAVSVEELKAEIERREKWIAKYPVGEKYYIPVTRVADEQDDSAGIYFDLQDKIDHYWFSEQECATFIPVASLPDLSTLTARAEQAEARVRELEEQIRKDCVDALGATQDWSGYSVEGLVTTLGLRYISEVNEAKIANERRKQADQKWMDALKEKEAVEEANEKLSARLAELEGQQPVGWITYRTVNRERCSTIHTSKQSMEASMAYCKQWDQNPECVPLYRQPVPAPASQPVAVAGKVVVETLSLYFEQGAGMGYERWPELKKQLVELPEPGADTSWYKHFHHISISDHSRMSQDVIMRDDKDKIGALAYTLSKEYAALLAPSAAGEVV